MPKLANPHEKYLETAISSASKEELTLMLYEGALKFSNQAVMACEKRDLQKINYFVKRVCDIIFELQLTLDRKYPISKNFDLLYDFIIEQITSGVQEMDLKKMEDARDLIREFRDMWKEAIKVSRTKQKS